MILFYCLLFYAGCNLWYFLFLCIWSLYSKKINHRNNVRPQKRIFICFCQGLGSTTKMSSTEAAGLAKGSFPSGPPFLRGYISFWILQWGRNWFLKSVLLPQETAKTTAQFKGYKSSFLCEPNPLNFQFILDFG